MQWNQVLLLMKKIKSYFSMVFCDKDSSKKNYVYFRIILCGNVHTIKFRQNEWRKLVDEKKMVKYNSGISYYVMYIINKGICNRNSKSD